LSSAESKALQCGTAASTSSEQLVDEEDIGTQVAIESSLCDVVAMQCQAVASSNEQLSATLLQNRNVQDAKHVVHLKFSRPCEALRDVLLKSDELAAVRQSLEAANFRVELNSGLKILVKPDHYEALMVAIEGQALYSEDVIVEPEFESIVTGLVKGLKKKHKVYPRGSNVIPPGFLLAAKDAGMQVSFARRVITIKVPSLRSMTDTDEGRKTV